MYKKKIQRTVTYHNVDRVKKDAYNVNQGPNRLLTLDKSLRLIFVGDRVNRRILLVHKKRKIIVIMMMMMIIWTAIKIFLFCTVFLFSVLQSVTFMLLTTP